jgi:hypothetical protein
MIGEKGGESVARRGMGFSGFRGLLYKLARFLGDVRAVEKGPAGMERRAVRRVAGRVTGRGLRKLFK